MLNKIGKLAANTGMRLSLLAGSIVFSCALINTAQAIPFNSISEVYFFGDSLTDGGFNDYFPTPSGKAPTSTTYQGYTWAQYIARDIKKFTLPSPLQYPYDPVSPPYHPVDPITNNTTPIDTALCGGPCPVSGLLTGVNYACSGSATNSIGNIFLWAPSLHAQVQQFVSTHPTLNPNAVYFIWSGANDLLKVLASSATSPLFEFLMLQASSTAANNVAQEVAFLSAHGAKRVVVMSLPNLGYTPLINDLINDFLAPPSYTASLKTLTFTFNSMLNQQLGKVIAQYGTKILYFDTYDLLDNVMLATKAGRPYSVGGESFMFTNYTSPVCGYEIPPAPYVVPVYVPAIECTQGSNGYLFADDVHPTDQAHRLLSLAVEQKILGWK